MEVTSFQSSPALSPRFFTRVRGTADGSPETEQNKKKKSAADVMAFLRKKGAVGRNQDFSTAMGVDEGPVGKNRSVGKARAGAVDVHACMTQIR